MPGITRRDALRLAAATTVGAVVPLAARTPAVLAAQTDSGVRALTRITVIDATGAPPRADMTVLVDGGRITAVGRRGEVNIPDGADVLDLPGKYVIPGLHDMHVHSFVSERISPALYLANGVTTVREMSGTATLRGWRARVESGDLFGPRWSVGSPIIDGAPTIGTPDSFVEVATVADARRAVRDAKRAGADFIKIYSRLSTETYRAVASEARRQGIRFAGHCPDAVPITHAAEAGQASIEHLHGAWYATSSEEAEIRRRIAALEIAQGDFLTWLNETYRLEWIAAGSHSPAKAEQVFARLARTSTRLVPTLGVHRVLDQPDDVRLDDDRLRYVPAWAAGVWPWALENYIAGSRTPDEAARWRELFERRLEFVGALDRAGVPVLAGTDAGDMPFVFPGFGLHDELALLVRAGLSPMRALQAATAEPARLLGQDETSGTVEEGKVADLVVLDADPLADIRNTSRIHAVVAHGRLISATRRRQMLADVERAAAEETVPPVGAARTSGCCPVFSARSTTSHPHGDGRQSSEE